MSHVCLHFSEALDNPPLLGENALHVFNHWLLEFQKCIQTLQDLIALSCHLEFHFIRKGPLQAVKCYNYIKSILEIQPIGLPQLQLSDRHINYIFQTVFAPTLPFSLKEMKLPLIPSSYGTHIFRNFLSCLGSSLSQADLTLPVFASKVPPLIPLKFSPKIGQIKFCSENTKLLKSVFSRDFG